MHREKETILKVSKRHKYLCHQNIMSGPPRKAAPGVPTGKFTMQLSSNGFDLMYFYFLS